MADLKVPGVRQAFSRILVLSASSHALRAIPATAESFRTLSSVIDQLDVKAAARCGDLRLTDPWNPLHDIATAVNSFVAYPRLRESPPWTDETVSQRVPGQSIRSRPFRRAMIAGKAEPQQTIAGFTDFDPFGTIVEDLHNVPERLSQR